MAFLEGLLTWRRGYCLVEFEWAFYLVLYISFAIRRRVGHLRLEVRSVDITNYQLRTLRLLLFFLTQRPTLELVI